MQLNRIWRAVAFTLSNLNKFPCCPVCSAILSLLRLDYILSPFLFPLILSFPILFSLDDSLQNTMIICAKRRSLVCCGKGGKISDFSTLSTVRRRSAVVRVGMSTDLFHAFHSSLFPSIPLNQTKLHLACQVTIFTEKTSNSKVNSGFGAEVSLGNHNRKQHRETTMIPRSGTSSSPP